MQPKPIPAQEVQNKIFLRGGDFFATKEEIILSTILGSCVAVCLYDQFNGVMGMNHIILPRNKYQKNIACASEDGKYGHCAMELLLEKMLTLGANIHNIKAKAFGGSSMYGTSKSSRGDYCIGDKNTSFIRLFLSDLNIPLVSEDLGGFVGRNINFFPNTYAVEVKKLNTPLSKNLFKRETHEPKQVVAV